MSAMAADAVASAAADALPSVEKPAKARKRAKDADVVREKAFHTWAKGKKAARALCCHRVPVVVDQPIHEEDRRIARAAWEMFKETEAFEDAARRRREWALLHKCSVCHPPCDADGKKLAAAAKQRARKRARAESPVGGHAAALPVTPPRPGAGYVAEYPDTIAASAVHADLGGGGAFLDDFSFVTGGELCAKDHEGSCVCGVPPHSFEAQCETLAHVLAQYVDEHRAGQAAALVTLACARAWTGVADSFLWWCDHGFRKGMDMWHMWLTQCHALAIANTLADVVDAARADEDIADGARHATLLRFIGPCCGEHTPAHAASLFNTFKVFTQHVCVPLQRLVVAMTTECVCGNTYPHVSDVCVLRGSAGAVDI
jgi:hypothetical protein